MFKSKKIKENSGFTIIEVMIATVIITIGLIGALTLSLASMKFGKISINRVIAANLAQEGIEVIRAMRDDIWLSGDDNPWDNSPFNIAGGSEDGIVFWNTLSDSWEWDSTNSGYWSGARFYLDTQERYIQYGSLPFSGTPTNFWRNIIIYDDPDADGNPRRRIIVKVKWQEADKFSETQIENWLYNWK
jgi:prepilin-type N-terminal cleavage/methylation domain-containing protein